MIRDALKGLGVVAYGDPMPGPGVPSGLSGATTYKSGIRLVGSMGKARWASYRDVYFSNPFVHAAANFIARGVGRLPLHVYQLNAEAEKERLRSDIPLTPGRPQAGVQLDRVLNTPMDGLSRMTAVSGRILERLIYGNALDEIVNESGFGLPTGLRRVPWANVDHVEEDGYGRAKWYEISENGKPGTKRRLYPDTVIHYGLGSTPGQACGESLLESCKYTLALHEALMRHLMAYFENSARGSGHFKVDNEKQAAQARQMITQLYTSPENAGKVLVTSGEWVTMADNPEHSSIVALIKESRVEIAAAFQVPPPVLGLLEQAIRANVKEMREQFNRDTIGPWATDDEDEIEAQLCSRYPSWQNLIVEFELAEQLRPDLEARALVYQRMASILTIDEIRTMEGKAPLKIAGVTDVPWAGSGMLPLPTAAASRGKSSAPPPNDSSSDVVGLGEARQLVALLEAIDEKNANGNGHHELSEVT